MAQYCVVCRVSLALNYYCVFKIDLPYFEELCVNHRAVAFRLSASLQIPFDSSQSQTERLVTTIEEILLYIKIVSNVLIYALLVETRSSICTSNTDCRTTVACGLLGIIGRSLARSYYA
jgi:hypothetical protein